MAEKQWNLLTSFEAIQPGVNEEWIIIVPDEDHHVEFQITQLECDECKQVLEVRHLNKPNATGCLKIKCGVECGVSFDLKDDEKNRLAK